jgi:hypothetical protein
MIDEVQRDRFLANPDEFAGAGCLALAAIAGNDAEETTILESWAFLKERLTGTGTRIGYGAFLVLLRESEGELQNVVAEFAGDSARSSWRFVAAPVLRPENSLATLQRVEWQAHKQVQFSESETLMISEVSGAR